MAVAVKGVSSFWATRKGIISTILVVLVVLALFFIPEIIEFERSLVGTGGGKAGTITLGSNSGRQLSERQQKALQSASPLEKTLMLLEEQLLDKTTSSSSTEVEVVDDEAAVKNLNDSDSFDIRSWKDMRDIKVRQYLKQVNKDSITLLKAIDPSYRNTRFAILDFTNGVKFVIDDAKARMTPAEALRYLEHLQFNVTKAMFRDNVAKEVYSDWSLIKLDKLVGGSRTTRLNNRYESSFSPKLYVTQVQAKMHETGKSYVQVEGVVSAVGLSKLSMLRNGVPIRDIGVGKVFAGTYRRFRFKFPAATGVFTLKVTSHYGETYTKSYVFLSQTRDPNRLQFKGPDLRVDKYFRL